VMANGRLPICSLRMGALPTGKDAVSGKVNRGLRRSGLTLHTTSKSRESRVFWPGFPFTSRKQRKAGNL